MNRNSDRTSRPALLSLVAATGTTGAEVRPDRVREARARIEGGYYDRTAIRRALVAALLDELVASS